MRWVLTAGLFSRACTCESRAGTQEILCATIQCSRYRHVLKGHWGCGTMALDGLIQGPTPHKGTVNPTGVNHEVGGDFGPEWKAVCMSTAWERPPYDVSARRMKRWRQRQQGRRLLFNISMGPARESSPTPRCYRHADKESGPNVGLNRRRAITRGVQPAFQLQ